MNGIRSVFKVRAAALTQALGEEAATREAAAEVVTAAALPLLISLLASEPVLQEEAVVRERL